MLGFPRPQTGPEPPFSGKEGFGVQKPPLSLVLEKGVFYQKIPFFFLRGNTAEMGIFWPKNSLFQPVWGRREMGVLGPWNPLFQKMGVRGPVWGRGNRNTSAPLLPIRDCWRNWKWLDFRTNCPGINYIPPPPAPFFFCQKVFFREGGSSCIFRSPPGTIFIAPSFIHPPPPEGCLQGCLFC